MVVKRKKILVVGAGFAGAVVARELADTGRFEIDVIDQRDHIAGNAFDTVHRETGSRYHVYGPHIFHTNDVRIFNYLSRFVDWIPYKHRVVGMVEGVGDIPIPINIDTVNALYKSKVSNGLEMEDFLNNIKVDVMDPKNAWEFLISIYGERLTELFFSRYTRKMWGLDLYNLPVSVVARIPVRKNHDSFYFDDKFQFMPAQGYESLFNLLLDHDNISVRLLSEFEKKMEKEYSHVFNSMPIDVYYENRFGELPYRSIKFEHRVAERFCHAVPTVNFTDASRYTRKTNWDLYPGCGGGNKHMITYEIPCDYKENNYERYYPVKTVDGEPQRLYRKYKALACTEDKVTFIGRCGQYIYYDMHQVVANSLAISKRFIQAD